MNTPLTSRDRMNRALRRLPHDRVPRHETFWTETLARWANEGLAGGEEGALEALGSDCRTIQWIWPAPFPNRREILEETGDTVVVKDAHGKITRTWKHKSGTPEHVGFECETSDVWRSTFKPALEANPIQCDPDAARQRAAAAGARQLWSHIATVEPFEQTRALMGDETTMIAFLDEPDWVEDVARSFTDATLATLDHLWNAGVHPDGLWVYGDMAFNHSTVCSPATYRELIWPQHRRFALWAHDRNLPIIFHTDGNVNGVLDLFIEAGFDALQPLESKAGMDIRRIAPTHGQRISFFGNIDVMKMIRGNLDELEEEIATKFSAGMAHHGYIYHSDHSVPPQVSWPLYQKIIRLVDRHGRYPAG